MSLPFLPEIATTTRAAYNNCHPDIPLQADDLRYIDLTPARGNQNFVAQLSEAIDWSQDVAPPYHQRLFTGHRGSGKTTELFRLKKELERLGFLVLYLDVEQKLDLEDIEYTDLLLSIMTGLFEQAQKAELALSEKLLEAIHEWFYERTETQTKGREADSELITQATAEARLLPFVLDFFASLTARIKVGSSQKTEIRKVFDRDLVVFNDRLNALIGEVRKQAQAKKFRDLVIIADGLEKMPFKMCEGKSNHDLLFVDNAERLKVPKCHLIYTVPISLAYNASLSNSFGGDFVAVIPMVKLSTENCALFQRLVEKRIEVNSVFESKAQLDELIQYSGGAVRDLMRLIRIACQGTKQITSADVTRARTILMTEYDRLLREEDFAVLEIVHRTRQVTANEKYGRLLHWRVLHEYLNGKRWADVHPLVLSIERVQTFLKYAQTQG